MTASRSRTGQSRSTPEPHVVCVLGMHRSGTSLVSRVLNLLGVDLGPEDQLMKPFPHNPKGFWENQLITDLNDEILKTLGGSWRNPPPFPARWETSAELGDLRRRARKLIHENFDGKPLWGWKDPRTCLTLPFWQRLLPDIRYVICVRDPIDVARSLEPQTEFDEGIELWLPYVSGSLEHTRGRPRIFVLYDDLMSDWKSEVERLSNFVLGAGPTKEALASIDDFLEEELWHHRTDVIDAVDAPELPYPTKALYFALVLHAEARKRDATGDDAGDLVGKALDLFSAHSREAAEAEDGPDRGPSRDIAELRRTFERPLAVLEAHAAELRAANAAAEHESGELRRMLEERSGVEEQVAALETNVADLRAAKEAAEREADALRTAVETLRGELATATDAGAAERIALEAANAAAEQESSELRRMLEERSGVEEQVAALETNVVDLRAAKEAAEREADALRTAVETLRGELATATDAGAAERIALEAANAAAEQESSELRRTLREQAKDIERLSRRVTVLSERQVELRESLRGAHNELLRRDEEMESEFRRVGESGGTGERSEDASGASTSIRYDSLVLRIKAGVRALVPAGATVAVVSRGDDALLAFEGRRGWHFPRTEQGLYAGHYPADSGAAIAHLEDLRAEGAEFLLFPSTSFWWLDHYPELRQHLDKHYRVLASVEEQFLIYDVRGDSARRPSEAESKHDLYGALVDRVRTKVDATLPPEATVAVVSRGDDALLMLDGRRGWHFPRTDEGLYAGYHPADSAAAIAHLEEVRAQGADFLVLPSSAFWWLDHYRDFAAYLEEHYRLVTRDENECAIYDLRKGDGDSAGRIWSLRRPSWLRSRSRPHDSASRASAGDRREETVAAASEPPARPSAAEQTPAREVIRVVEESRLFDEGYYVEAYPDVRASGVRPVEHFCTLGWTDGRSPNPYFDTRWYLRTNPDVEISGTNPLWHYIVEGEAEGRRPCAFFDPDFYGRATGNKESPLADYLAHVGRVEWRNPVELFDVAYYLAENPDVRQAGKDPVLHYIQTGHVEGRNPSRRFFTSYYRAKYLQGRLDINPLIHYYDAGEQTGNEIAPGRRDSPDDVPAEIRHWVSPGERFEEFDSNIAARAARLVKLIAFYLPQFHAIPENDRWWGQGFTEWRNIMRGVPRFEGHYQPRIPRDLGFYDLTNPEVMRKQVDLARQAGIYGFSFYYYWFNGKRLLERPLEQFLADPSLDFPFCIVWANENWTRRWDGKEADVLVRQEYDPDDDAALVDDLQRHFADTRYIRIDGRPLFLVYRLDIIPDGRRTVERWRKLWHERHGERPLIFLAQTFGTTDPRDFGLDGAVEFPPHKLTQGRKTNNSEVRLLDPHFKGQVYDYESVASQSVAEPYPQYPLIKTVVPSWDNDARRQSEGLVLHGSTPERYEAWLRGLVEVARRHPVYGENLVFVNAWNEWAEAAYLEPDVHYGAAHLNATARAVCGIRSPSKRKVLFVGHDAHPFGAQINLWHMGDTMRNQFGCDVAYLLRAGGAMVPQYERLGKVAVTDDDSERMRAFVRELRAEGYEHAITNTAATGRVLPVLKDAGFRVVSLIHELPGIIDEYDLHSSLESIVDESDAIVVAAQNVAEAVNASAPRVADKVVIRPQGLYLDVEGFSEAGADVRRKLGIPEHARIVLNVGSGDFRKGVDIFLHAAKLAAAETTDLHFVWVGKLNDDAARWLQDDVRGELQDRVHLLSYTDEVAPYFAAADVFFLTSREDPYPSVVLEAMQVGLPVVALRDSGGIEELVAEYGTVVDRNEIGEIVRALRDGAAEDDDAARESRKRAIREHFRFDEYCFDLLRLLDPALDKVSVVIPNFNYRDYLRDRLAGIFAQSYPLFEVIVLDDGSEDGSLVELERISEETGRRFQIVPNDRNSGSTFRQWAKACRLVRGDLVWIAEADDLSRPEFLERVVGKFACGDVAFAFSDSAQIDERGQPLGGTYKDYYRTSAGDLMDRDFVLDGESFVRRCLAERNLILNASSVVWSRRSLIDALDRCLDEVVACRLAGDWYLYAAAGLAGRQVAYVAEPLNIHRRHETSVTGSLEKRRHLEEVQHVHSAIARWLNADAGMRTRMETYEAELARLFGLSQGKRTNGDSDAGRGVGGGDSPRRRSSGVNRNGDQVA